MALASPDSRSEKLGSAFSRSPIQRSRDSRAMPGLRRYFLASRSAPAASRCGGASLIVTPTSSSRDYRLTVDRRGVVLASRGLATPLIFHLGLVTARSFNAAGRVDLSLRSQRSLPLTILRSPQRAVRDYRGSPQPVASVALPWAYAEFLALRRIDLHWREVTRTLFRRSRPRSVWPPLCTRVAPPPLAGRTGPARRGGEPGASGLRFLGAVLQSKHVVASCVVARGVASQLAAAAHWGDQPRV